MPKRYIAKARKCRQSGGIVVSLYEVVTLNGGIETKVKVADADYWTDNDIDAFDTALAMVKRANENAVIEESFRSEEKRKNAENAE